MLPAVRIYWIVTLVVLPFSVAWLLVVTGGSVQIADLAAHPFHLLLSLLFLAYAIEGFREMHWAPNNLRRNYPVLANIRYLLEFIRPEIQQYFIANNIEERPFNREQRNIIYRRAKGLNDTLPFGTQQDILEPGYRSLQHSISATTVKQEHARITIGGPQCNRPYSASRLNISGMSFGALSSNAIAALNKGAALGAFAHNTGEGSISEHHLQGGDLIWQLGTAYFGCRTPEGRLDEQVFAEKASQDAVKMIEIKISQGAKPSHGGVLPGAKVTEEIARIRTVEVGKTVVSPASHPEFSTPRGLLNFVQRLRELSDGKPIGFKLCIGRKSEFMAIIKAIRETGILPDFITVDGAEGGTGAAPAEFSNRLGTPCLEATFFVNQVLIGAGLRDKIHIISAGKTATGYDMLEKIAVGADTVNAARSMMMALGCIQSQSCNTNKCPTGVATTDPRRARAIDVDAKALRVRNFHHHTMNAFMELCGAMGYDNPSKLKPRDIVCRYDAGYRYFDEIHPTLQHNQLLDNTAPTSYLESWTRAHADHF
ncbi:MAG: FMN-binding glutamate synthase family protein [Gammaproteobacteria bacterium]|nr:FMN-binding glutamate synthase family protein [Pseudomonadales bacterium]